MNSYFLMSKLKYFHLRPTDLKRSHNLLRGEDEITVQLLLSLSVFLTVSRTLGCDMILLGPVIAKLSDDAIVKAELLEVIQELKIHQSVSLFCYH